MCPNCGAPVGVPSREPTHPGLAGPLSRDEIARRAQLAGPRPLDENALANVGPAQVRIRRRRSSGNLAAAPDWRPLEAPLVCPPGQEPERVHVPRHRRRWQRESRWYHCLLYPLRAWSLVLGLGLILTALSGTSSHILLELDEFRLDSQAWPPLLLLGLPLLCLAYAAGFLDVTLSTAAAGQFGAVTWPGYGLVATRAALKWVVCFLAGPVVPAAAAFAFWLYGEEPRFVDRAILAELLIVSFGAWLLGLMAVADAGTLRAAAPGRVVELVLRLRWRALVPLAVAPVLLFLHARLALAGLEEVHLDGGLGVVFLAGAWMGGLFWGIFLFRLLGMWCYTTRPPEPPAGATA
jgi:hypothetical protein